MDSLRSYFPDADVTSDRYDPIEDDAVHDGPPRPIGDDERRMQVRAYNHWAGLLHNRRFPAVEDLEPQLLPDFGPYSVLLDFTAGVGNPSIRFLGDKLAEECVAPDTIGSLSDVPSRSLLSRITDHYMQILANQAPIGFEAEFVNQRGATILYRGILLPFSSDDDTIDFIYGVINWKELADLLTTDELLLEMEQVLDPQDEAPLLEDAVTDWAEVPGEPDVLELVTPLDADEVAVEWPEPEFGTDDVAPAFAALPDVNNEELAPTPVDEIVPDAMELADWLASARELAEVAMGTEDRSRHALYAAIGRAYDFSLAAASAPGDFQELVVDSGLTMQDRAPMTPIVKLVFGADYDKTRLAEYATALGHAHRIGLQRGLLAGYLSSAPGGLKAVVNEERRLKREEGGKPSEVRETPAEALARKLRELDYFPYESIEDEGAEFTVLVARRLQTGEIVFLGEVGDDIALLERAARKLVA
jgi:hypothetical protein